MKPNCLLIRLFVFLRIDYVEFCLLCVNYVVFSTDMFIDKLFMYHKHVCTFLKSHIFLAN